MFVSSTHLFVRLAYPSVLETPHILQLKIKKNYEIVVFRIFIQ